MANGLEAAGLLGSLYDLRATRVIDIFSGAFGLQFTNYKVKPYLRRRWLWSPKAHRLLKGRFEASYKGDPSSEPEHILQIGTQVDLSSPRIKHYVLTDMTIPQAIAAGHFAISNLDKTQLEKAILLQKQILQNSTGIFTLSNWTRESILSDFSIPEKKVKTVYAGSNYKPLTTKQYNRNQSEILFVGIDWERKGGPILIDAFQRLQKQLPNIKLTIVGCSPKIVIPGVNVEGYLRKSVPSELDRIDHCYKRASCFCLPSIFDPFPNVIIEAAFATLPAVAIDNGSRREAIIDGVTGKLAVNSSAEAVAEALYWLLSKPGRCTELGQNALTNAQSKFTWTHVVNRIHSYISSTTNNEYMPSL